MKRSSGQGISYDEYRFLRRFFKGCIEFRRSNDELEEYEEYNKLLLSYRRRFLSFLGLLWLKCVGNVSPSNPRDIFDVATEKDPMSLYLSMVNFVSECCHSIFFASENVVSLNIIGHATNKRLQVPNKRGMMPTFLLLQTTTAQFDNFSIFIFAVIARTITNMLSQRIRAMKYNEKKRNKKSDAHGSSSSNSDDEIEKELEVSGDEEEGSREEEVMCSGKTHRTFPSSSSSSDSGRRNGVIDHNSPKATISSWKQRQAFLDSL